MISSLCIAAAPLMLASLGALFTELSGALGIFIEGFMSLGAFFAWIMAIQTGSVFLGSSITALLAALSGWALARFVKRTGSNPFIVGLALNLAAGGITDALSSTWFGTKGVLRNPGISIPGPVALPLVGDIPVLGPLLSGQLPFVYVAWVSSILTGLIIRRTALGLRLRACGASPEAARERGIRPDRYQAGAWAAAAFLAALAGAALTFRVGVYAPGGVAGRGWIALAGVYLGFRRVGGTVIAAWVFALAEHIGLRVQGWGGLPATALLGVPAALALALYTLSCAVEQKGKHP
ncbi:MAG: ABC transporter permease [Treponema sp.]|jgi:simple sugar transport system permease protein|nr:ABC transporter permease [Treponema sp.]